MSRSNRQAPTAKNSTVRSRDDVVEKTLLASSCQLEGGLVQTDFSVPDMHCIGCIRSLERAIGSLAFVSHVRANLSLRKVSVIWQNGDANIVTISEAITAAGFDHTPYNFDAQTDEHQTKTGNRLLLALAVAGFAAVNIMLLSVSVWSGADLETTRLFHLISGLIAVPTVFYSGQPFFLSAIKALKARSMNMDVPISLAVLLALAISIYESLRGGQHAYFDAGVTLLFFLLIGRYLDFVMREKARNSVIQLADLSAKGALQVGEDDALTYLRLAEVAPDMIVRVMAGERFAVDGQIVKGSSDIDRSLVTGESVPVVVDSGSLVEAGTLNLTGPVDIRVLRDAKHSFLAEVGRLMEAAEQGRDRFTRIADRMAQIYAPAVHLLSALSFFGWLIATDCDWYRALYVAISVLIITCPCALGLAVPVVHVIAARRLIKRGILIRDGSGFERLEEVDHVVFDKTGTLTSDIPNVCEFGIKKDSDRAIAKALALGSSHPFSGALAKFVKLPPNTKVTEIHEVPGAGVEGMINGKQVRLGRSDWVAQISDHATAGQPNASNIAFGIENKPIALITFTEQPRREAEMAIGKLKTAGFDLDIVSGDNVSAVKRVADQLGIDSFKSQQLPADKVRHIELLNKQGKKTLMVGDGLNDSAALAAAHVCIAPAKASDIVKHSADFVFTGESLNAVPTAIDIARKAGRLVRQNFFLAIAYNAVAIPFAIAGYVTPLLAAVAMSTSSIIVVLNSMRLAGELPISPFGKIDGILKSKTSHP